MNDYESLCVSVSDDFLLSRCCRSAVSDFLLYGAANHPLNTAPIPPNVRYLEQCSTLGSMLCGAVSTFSGEAAVERRSACIAYLESSGKRVEQCGSLPASQP